MTTNPESGSRAVGAPGGVRDDVPTGDLASHAPRADELTADDLPLDDLPPDDLPPDDLPPDDLAPDDLPLDEATAYGIDGYDPDDPWNAVLCVESERAVTILPLTPKSLDQLVSTLGEVRDAQRFALGVHGDSDAGLPERPGVFHQMADAARVATGSAPVARLWQTSTRGRVIIIGGAVLFVVLGIVASALLR